MTEVLNGTASLEPAYNIIERTFMVANYGANGGCVDNDDGKQAWHAARKSLSSSCLGLKPEAARRCCCCRFEVDSHATVTFPNTSQTGATQLGWHIGGFQGARGSDKGAVRLARKSVASRSQISRVSLASRSRLARKSVALNTCPRVCFTVGMVH